MIGFEKRIRRLAGYHRDSAILAKLCAGSEEFAMPALLGRGASHTHNARDHTRWLCPTTLFHSPCSIRPAAMEVAQTQPRRILLV